MPKVIKRGIGPAPTSSRPMPGPPPVAAPPQKKRIIEREVVGATHEAAEIRRRAEEDAQRILDEAQEQAYETRQHGFEEGKQEALAQYTQQISQALLQVQRMADELEPLYVGLIRDCVEKVLNQELQVNPQAIVGVVRGALVDARQQREIIVRVNPADADALERNKNRLLEILARANTVEVRPDASVTRGGCVVVTELGSIDASLERQLEALAQAIEIEYREGSSGASYDESELDPEDDPGGGY
ncbi:MAG: type III secretion system stator protein SctL [Deltaproteobacteria bacterium]|nr:type III secretion system stator protein SctL [Deltaproteobacteria bacterium]